MADGTTKITINGDEFLKKHDEWAKGEASDASNSGKRREAIGAYAEKNGLENKAVSQMRAGLKIKNEGKRKDWLRTVQLMLPVVEREVFGNEMSLDNPNEEAQQEAAQAAATEANEIAAEHGVGEEATQETPTETDPETEEFNSEVDQVMGGESNVTPLDFGAGAKA